MIGLDRKEKNADKDRGGCGREDGKKSKEKRERGGDRKKDKHVIGTKRRRQHRKYHHGKYKCNTKCLFELFQHVSEAKKPQWTKS